MLADFYYAYEPVIINISLALLFILMTFAVHDVLTKNNVPLVGKVVAYSVLFLGSAGFLAKGIIQLIVD